MTEKEENAAFSDIINEMVRKNNNNFRIAKGSSNIN